MDLLGTSAANNTCVQTHTPSLVPPIQIIRHFGFSISAANYKPPGDSFLAAALLLVSGPGLQTMSGSFAGVDFALLLVTDPGVPRAVDVLPDAFFLPRKKVLIQGSSVGVQRVRGNEKVK